MFRKTLLLGLFGVAGLMVFNACKKDNDTTDLTSVEDVNTSQDLLEDVDDEVNETGYLVDNTQTAASRTCVTVTAEKPKGTYPNTITIDYGTGCTGRHGRTRKGKILVAYSANPWTPGATKTITFQDFYIDDAKIEGTKVWTNNGLNNSGEPTFTRTVTNAKVTFTDGTFATWNANHTITIGAGALTPFDVTDDKFMITGGSTGVTRKGVNFTSAITTALEKNYACRFISKGVRSITTDNKVLVLDYGNGNCDNKVTVTKPNGDTEEVTIRRWWK